MRKVTKPGGPDLWDLGLPKVPRFLAIHPERTNLFFAATLSERLALEKRDLRQRTTNGYGGFRASSSGR
jgi:hypothetical protein